MTQSAIKISDLKKTYKSKNGADKEALKGISLDIPRGSFFGLLGPNGAGKSTIINILAGLVIKTSGTVEINGINIDTHLEKAKMNIGIVPQELMIDTFFTVREALDFHAGYYGVPKEKRRTQEIIDAMKLGKQADVYSRRLSGGMKRRLLVGKALVHNPPVLVLDEPTAGVDVELREQLWDYVRKLNRSGTTILLTTHYLEEAQELCDEIAIINHGAIVVKDSKENLMNKFGRKHLIIKPESEIKVLPEALSMLGGKLEADGKLHIEYEPTSNPTGQILEEVHKSGIRVSDIAIEQTSLEDVFKHLTSVNS